MIFTLTLIKEVRPQVAESRFRMTVHSQVPQYSRTDSLELYEAERKCLKYMVVMGEL